LGDNAVKKDVVDQIFGGDGEGGEHLGDLVGEGYVVLFFSALGGQGGKVASFNWSIR
jgi:hypothetical protein